MRKLVTILLAVLITACVFAQSPEKMSYQAIVRNASDNLVTNAIIGMQISILQGSATGTAVYVETQTTTTNANGLVAIEIGTGTTTDDFSAIDWGNDIYFIKTETDPSGGTNYTITGTNQLLSVPYALHSKTVENEKDGDVTNELQFIDVSNDTLYLSKANSLRIPSLLFDKIDFPTYTDGLKFSRNAPLLIGNEVNGSFLLHDHRLIINTLGSDELNAGILIVCDSTEWDHAPLEVRLDFKNNNFPGEKMIQLSVHDEAGASNCFFGMDENRDFFISHQIGYRHFTFSKFGNFGVDTKNPKSKAHIHDGDLYIDNASNGIILTKPDGSGCYRITIDNNGDFVKTSILCPE